MGRSESALLHLPFVICGELALIRMVQGDAANWDI